MGAGFVLQTGYVGTHSVRQDVTYYEINPGLIPGAGANGRPLFVKYGANVNRSIFIPMANQRYDALQTNLTKRFSQGLFLTSSFTWSKAIGINAGNSDSGLRFYVPSQFSKNKAVADFDRKLSWVLAANWEAPFGKNKKFATQGPAAAVLGGWQLNPNVALYTGRPFLVATDGSSLNAPQNHTGSGSDQSRRTAVRRRRTGRPVLRSVRLRAGQPGPLRQYGFERAPWSETLQHESGALPQVRDQGESGTPVPGRGAQPDQYALAESAERDSVHAIELHGDHQHHHDGDLAATHHAVGSAPELLT